MNLSFKYGTPQGPELFQEDAMPRRKNPFDDYYDDGFEDDDLDEDEDFEDDDDFDDEEDDFDDDDEILDEYDAPDVSDYEDYDYDYDEDEDEDDENLLDDGFYYESGDEDR